ncbi:protein yippee-like 5 [Alosa sapidissima]|uniref:protein yippee-like 5 n=1 Tax=Alosa sapidissima TaxID=34773 RepID=UPI001C09931A|nr:protein yippee-like 5 [Alosa sapidissima]
MCPAIVVHQEEPRAHCTNTGSDNGSEVFILMPKSSEGAVVLPVEAWIPNSNCDTILTNRSELISTRFTGATGWAFLLNKVVNLQYSEVQDHVMLTGRHMVCDVSCKNCNSKLGWIYEFATEDSQRYKEGRVILERALVRESKGFEEHVPSDAS